MPIASPSLALVTRSADETFVSGDPCSAFPIPPPGGAVALPEAVRDHRRRRRRDPPARPGAWQRAEAGRAGPHRAGPRLAGWLRRRWRPAGHAAKATAAPDLHLPVSPLWALPLPRWPRPHDRLRPAVRGGQYGVAAPSRVPFLRAAGLAARCSSFGLGAASGGAGAPWEAYYARCSELVWSGSGGREKRLQLLGAIRPQAQFKLLALVGAAGCEIRPRGVVPLPGRLQIRVLSDPEEVDRLFLAVPACSGTEELGIGCAPQVCAVVTCATVCTALLGFVSAVTLVLDGLVGLFHSLHVATRSDGVLLPSRD